MKGTIPNPKKLDLPGKIIDGIKSLNQFVFHDDGILVRKSAGSYIFNLLINYITGKYICENPIIAKSIFCDCPIGLIFCMVIIM